MPYKAEYQSRKSRYNPALRDDGSDIVPRWKLDKELRRPIYFWKPDQSYGYFGQWYLCDMIDENGEKFNCCEQFMMYHKAKTFDDAESMENILLENHPKDQKALGRLITGFSDEEWDKVKYDIVVRGNLLKFTQCDAPPGDTFVYPPDGKGSGETVSLRELLLATGDCEVAEASKYDRVWGIGFNAQQAQEASRKSWGQNLLGKALMEVRARFKELEAGEAGSGAHSLESRQV